MILHINIIVNYCITNEFGNMGNAGKL